MRSGIGELVDEADEPNPWRQPSKHRDQPRLTDPASDVRSASRGNDVIHPGEDRCRQHRMQAPG
jgi:hypothetical protein